MMDYSKLKKRTIPVLSTLAGLYVLFLLSGFVLTPVVNSHKSEIVNAIKTSTGFDTKIDKISVVTAPDLSAGIKINSLSMSIPEAKKPFLETQDAGVRLALLPLIAGKVRLSYAGAKYINSELVIKPDGNFLILDSIPKQDDTKTESFTLPLGLKLSNHLPDIKAKDYKISLIDEKTSTPYFVEGKNLNISDFVLDKKVKISTTGKMVLNGTTVSNYDIKFYNKIMPALNLDDIVFPKDITVEKEEDTAAEQTMPFNIIDILNSVYKNQLSADLTTDIKTSGTLKQPHLKGLLKVDALSVAVDGKKLPESYAGLKFKGNKTEIDSVFFSSSDTNEKTQVIGSFTTGKKPSLDMTLRSNAKFNNIITLIDSILTSFEIKDFNTLSATGAMDADFNINSDLKKVTSNGYLKIAPSSLTYGLYNIFIDNIRADIDLTNNNINIKNAGFSILGHPLKLGGTIGHDAQADLKLTASKLPVKGLLAAAGQGALLKDNNINSGSVSLDATLQGKLNKPEPKVSSTVKDINILNKPSSTKITLKDALIKLLYDGEKASGDININSLMLDNPSAVVSVPKTNILIDEKNINIKNSYLLVDNSRIDIKGDIKDYISEKMNINLNANGKLKSSAIAKLLPADFGKLISYKGEMPLNIDITGNSTVQNVKAQLKADPQNYISLVDIDALKNKNTKIHTSIEIIGDSLTFSDTGISSDKALVAKLTGGISKLYSTPKLNLNIAVPNTVSFPIWGVKNSNISANGSVSVTGTLSDPKMRGTVNLMDISMSDIDFAIKDLVADLSGSILNGSATARSFKFGGIEASDLSGTFSLKDYSKFYLNDLSANAFDGKIKGRLSYDIPTSKTGLEMSGSGMNSTKAVYGAVGIKNALTGTLGFNAKLAVQGLTDKEIIKSMLGNVDFTVDDGRFVSIGKFENLVAAQNIASNSILKSAISALSTLSTIQETDKFKSINGVLSLNDGSAKLTKILVSGPLMSYYVTGTYNILPNTANLIILGRLDAKVVSCLGVLGELSADKLLSYIPKFGTMTSKILNQLTSDPANENTALIPALSSGSTSYKDFKVIFNGAVESSSSVKSFKWLSKCDTSKMNVKEDIKNAKEAVKTNITNQIEQTKTNINNVKTNVNNAVEAQKAKAQAAKADLQKTKEDIQNAKNNAKQSADNLKNLLKNAAQKSQEKVQTPAETTETAAPAAASGAE